jgi:hypothetical protein
MQTEDDDFPYTSDDPSLAPIENKDAILSLTSQQLDDLRGTMRLIVGSALNGKDLYVKRLRQMQAVQESIKPESIVIDEDEVEGDQLKYLLLGILFETPDLIQRGLVTVEQVSMKAYGLFSKILSPITSSWIFSPVRDQYGSAAARGEKVIDRLVMKGRIEEQNSRLALQQKTIDDLINELLKYVILKTDATQIIQEAGIGVAGGVTDEFREQSSNVDSILDQKLRSIFHKRVPPQSDTTPSKSAEEG